MAESIGNSNRITREYLDSLLIETRYMDSMNPTLTYTLFGETFSSPIMTAALSHLGEERTKNLALGAKKAGAVMWLGMADEKEVEMCADTGVRMIEIIKPYQDRELIYRKIAHAEKCGLLAVGIDIDHPFANDGSPDIVDGAVMEALKSYELSEIVRASSLPVIAKGVLSVSDAKACVGAGARGLVLSHHNNRIEYAIPALAILPEIQDAIDGAAGLFVDGEIRTGMDAFKALALGASGVCIGRPLMKAAEAGADGVYDYFQNANAQLAKAMAYTGCTDLSRMDRSVIRRL